MTEAIKNLNRLMYHLSKYIENTSEKELSKKLNTKKWSKKELLGHLIDSGIHNLIRFTEIQFEEKPYLIKSYKQDESVQANNYQNAQINDLLDLLIAVNKRVISIVKVQTNKMQEYEIIVSENKKTHLRFLIEDYIKHFEHHAKQIIT